MSNPFYAANCQLLTANRQLPRPPPGVVCCVPLLATKTWPASVISDIKHSNARMQQVQKCIDNGCTLPKTLSWFIILHSAFFILLPTDAHSQNSRPKGRESVSPRTGERVGKAPKVCHSDRCGGTCLQFLHAFNSNWSLKVGSSAPLGMTGFGVVIPTGATSPDPGPTGRSGGTCLQFSPAFDSNRGLKEGPSAPLGMTNHRSGTLRI